MNKVSTTPAADTSIPVSLPPIECAPWCEDGNGHTDAHHPDDQYCIANGQDIELMREAPEQITPGGTYYRRTLSTSMQRDPFAEPFVTVGVDGLFDVKLTRDESKALRKALERFEGLGA